MSLTLPTELLSYLPENTRAELLSKAYVYSVVACAGVNIYKPEYDMGVDLSFKRVDKREERHKNRLADVATIPLQCQLKASKNCTLEGDQIVYKLDADNYNDLVNSFSSILVLLWLPSTIDNWVFQDTESLHIFKCAYYYKLVDRTEVPNKTKKTIRIPKSQVFTAEALLRLIDEIQPRLP